MSNTKFRVLHGIGIALLALLVIIANTTGNLAGGLLNTYVGSGKPSISTPADKADWDADYYEVQYASAEEAKEAGYAVALVCTWADEQTMRELFLRPFEIAIREGRMAVNYYDESGTMQTCVKRAGVAIMAAQCGVGTQLGHTNHELLTDLVRGEWNVEGLVHSDYWVWNGDNHRDYALRTGCDTYLCMPMTMMWSISDYDSPTARSVMRNAIHNLAYAVANSNAMQGMAPGAVVKVGPANWQIGIWGLTAVCVLLIANAIRMVVKRGKDELAHPELYKRGKRAEARLQKKLAKLGA